MTRLVLTNGVRARCLSAPQEAALHPELHPHQPVCGVHPQGHGRLHQGRGAVRGRPDGRLPAAREFAFSLISVALPVCHSAVNKSHSECFLCPVWHFCCDKMIIEATINSRLFFLCAVIDWVTDVSIFALHPVRILSFTAWED